MRRSGGAHFLSSRITALLILTIGILASQTVAKPQSDSSTGGRESFPRNKSTSTSGTTSSPRNRLTRGVNNRYVQTPGIGRHVIHSHARTWHEARKICQQEGGDLAVINSKAESQALAELMARSYPHYGSDDSGYVLIGFNDVEKEGQYVTVDGRTIWQAGFSEWASGGPNNWRGRENCGSIYKDGRLNDIFCDKKCAFACELPLLDEVGPRGPVGPRGIPGIKGDAGIQGPTGRVGQKGETGAKGAPGAAGENGTKGATGSPGLDGLKGNKGDLGATGPPGRVGPVGPPGSDGAQGLKGDQGEPGTPGSAGLRGEKGDKGTAGLSGSPGNNGVPGHNGFNGKDGSAGVPGLDGSKGEPGDKGEKGDVGLKGDAGPSGLPGPIGLTGPPGEAGPVGRSGSNGVKGGSGLPGISGQKGEPGVNGAVGTQGLRGETGSPGPRGEPGLGYNAVCMAALFDLLSSQPNGLIDGGQVPTFVGNSNSAEKCREFIEQANEQMSKTSSPNPVQSNGRKESPAKTCKDLFVAYPDMPSGEYWVDPNDGDVSDAIQVHCDAEGGSTCLTSEFNRTEPFTHIGDGREVWLSEIEDEMKIRYAANPSQIIALQASSSHAEQNVTYHCIKSVGYFDAENQTDEKGLKLLAWNDVELGPRGSRQFRYDVISDGCRDRPDEWKETVVAYRTDRPSRLPVMDVGLRDVGKPDQQFFVDIGEVCFK